MPNHPLVGFLFWLLRALFFHADTPAAPPRTAEYLLAWSIIFWGLTVTWFPGSMDGPSYVYLLQLAAEHTWGVVGVSVGLLRVAALMINGLWRRTPLFRFLCAFVGACWWVTIGGCYWLATSNGAQPFPMLGVYPVLVFFEGYSCYRCGQDARAMSSFSFPRRPVAVGGNYGT